jgi:hypothetical protein
MAGEKKNQLTRYGAIAKDIPFVTGKSFFLVNANEQAEADFQTRYPVDEDGYVRVYTSWASVIAAAQTFTDSDVIFVSPLFTTAPTKAQQLQLDAVQCVIIQAASLLPDGSYIAATLTAPSLATTTTEALFQINGRVELIDIMGEVVTTTGATITAKYTNIPAVGSTTDLCATGTIANLAVGNQMFITGTLATAIQTTTQSVFLRQATALILTQGVLQLTQSATTTGNVKHRLRYRAIDPGSFVSPLI